MCLYMAQELGGTVAIMLHPYGSEKKPQMTVVAGFWAERSHVGVHKPLISASVNLSTSGVGGTSAACLLALYELDKEAYRREIGVSPIGA